jgi:hypothetical protein
MDIVLAGTGIYYRSHTHGNNWEHATYCRSIKAE